MKYPNKKYSFAFIIIILLVCSPLFFIDKKSIDVKALKYEPISEAEAASDFEVSYGEGNITVDSCKLSVYTASDPAQKAKGMLGFTDDTFKKDGMIFLGSDMRYHYYHTMGMKMDIMIMGLVKTGENIYSIVKTPLGKPIFSPPGIETIKLQGESILEVPVKKYENGLKNCLFGSGQGK